METSDLMFIRGGRILKQLQEEHAHLMEDSTADQLDQNIRRAWPHTRKRQNATNEVTVNTCELIPYIGTKMLHVRSTTTTSGSGHKHKQAIQFMKVEYAQADSPEVVTYNAYDGVETHMVPIDLNNHNVRCRCSCMDFHFRFANYNSSDRSLVGKPPPLYVRKTTTRPPVNPMQVPGMCKHLLKLVMNLQGQRLVRQ